MRTLRHLPPAKVRAFLDFVLASIAPQRAPGVNVIFYHQEFDLNIFAPAPCLPTRKVHSYLHMITHYETAWRDYQGFKRLFEPEGYEVRAYGGLCPDGSKTGSPVPCTS